MTEIKKENILIFVSIVVGLAIVFWLVCPKFMHKREKFTEEIQKPKPKAEVEEKRVPFVDPKAGTLLDGPGFERGEVDGAYLETASGIPSNYYFLDDGANGEFSIQHNLCSKSCCSEQWPTPFKQKFDPYVCANKDKFVTSNIMCQNSFQDSGCACITQSQADFMYNRGGNGREWF